MDKLFKATYVQIKYCMSSIGWSHFWKDPKDPFDKVMKISTTLYASKMEKLFHLKPTDSVFDYGCGPGFLVDYLTDRNISVTGADINKSYVEKNKIHIGIFQQL